VSRFRGARDISRAGGAGAVSRDAVRSPWLLSTDRPLGKGIMHMRLGPTSGAKCASVTRNAVWHLPERGPLVVADGGNMDFITHANGRGI